MNRRKFIAMIGLALPTVILAQVPMMRDSVKANPPPIKPSAPPSLSPRAKDLVDQIRQCERMLIGRIKADSPLLVGSCDGKLHLLVGDWKPGSNECLVELRSALVAELREEMAHRPPRT